MSAKILNGTWTRKVRWERNGEWRTDIFKTTLANPSLHEAEYVLENGRRVIISAEELRRVLIGGRDHYHGKTWGPFNINPEQQTLDGQPVHMEVIA